MRVPPHPKPYLPNLTCIEDHRLHPLAHTLPPPSHLMCSIPYLAGTLSNSILLLM